MACCRECSTLPGVDTLMATQVRKLLPRGMTIDESHGIMFFVAVDKALVGKSVLGLIYGPENAVGSVTQAFNSYRVEG